MIDVGHRVRDYEIVAHLSRGGMATIFLARRVGPQGFARPAAIKIVHPHLVSDPELVRMFLDEARSSACIQHPNVVRVEELGEVEGTYFLAMEYVHGEPLASLLAAVLRDRRALPVEAAAFVAQSAAAGLHAAHDTCDAMGKPLRLVHRDISPQNLLVSVDGHVTVIDFGVAKVANASVQSEVGLLKGKLAYMSPEQASGGHVDRRTDVYALGIVLWEMLTMRRLFAGGNEIDVLRRVQNPEVTKPSAMMSAVPPALDDVVLRALAPDPAARFQTAEELARALARAVPEGSAAGPHLAAIVRDALGERIEARRRELRGAPGSADDTLTLDDDEPTIAARAPREDGSPTMAVMPFRIVGAADASLGPWISDDLRDVLSRVSGLRVKARAAPRGESEDASAYGERLGVELVVTGRVHYVGDQVRLAIALTNVDDGFQRWSGRFDCGSAEVLDASDKIARAIASEVGQGEVAGELRANADTESIELYAKIRRLIPNVSIGATFPSELVDRALAIAPRDPTMLAIVAQCLARETFRPDATSASIARARRVAEQAIELGPDLPEPWLALAHVHYVSDADSAAGAVRALRRAIANGPSVADAHDLLGRILSEAGLFDEAIRLLDHALWLDPTMALPLAERAKIAALRGQWPEAVQWLERVREHAGAPRHALTTMRLSVWAGRRLMRFSTDDTAPHVGIFLRLALRALEERKLSPEDIEVAYAAMRSVPARLRARRTFYQLVVEVFSAVGESEAALTVLGTAVEEGLDDASWIDGCPLLHDMRLHPRFAPMADVVRARADEVRRAWDEW